MHLRYTYDMDKNETPKMHKNASQVKAKLEETQRIL